MIDKYVLASNDDGDLAVRTVQATESSSVTDTTSVITATDDGKLAVRVVGSGGGDQHNLGWYATESALTTAHATAEAGDWAIVGATDTVWVWDTDNEEWVDSDQKGQVTSVNGKTGVVVLNATDVDAIPQYSTMPAASASNLGDIVQFVGATGTYTNGYFYESSTTGTPSSATATQTVGTGLTNITVNLQTLESVLVNDYELSLADGTITIVCVDAEENYWDASIAIGEGSGSSNTDPSEFGVTYSGGSIAVGDTIVVTYTANSATNAWVRKDVQPAPEALPDQTGQSGKFLTTDGSSASWGNALANRSNQTNSLAILGDATKTNATSVGEGAKSSGQNGTAVGCDAYARGDNSTAVGKNAKAFRGTGVSIGVDSEAGEDASIAIGYNAKISEASSTGAVSIGSNTQVFGYSAIALGNGAKASGNRTIQIGYGTNSTQYTMCVGAYYNNQGLNYQLLDLTNGTIPEARLADTTNAQQGDVLTLDSNGNAVWQAGGGGSSPTQTSIQIDMIDWQSVPGAGYLCDVSVQGVTSNSIVFVSAVDPISMTEWANCKIMCTNQMTNQLTFECETQPNNPVNVNIVIFN